jgi:hypothetical protein
VGIRLQWPRDTLYPQKLALTSPTSDGRSVDIVRSWTQVTEFELFDTSKHKNVVSPVLNTFQQIGGFQTQG